MYLIGKCYYKPDVRWVGKITFKLCFIPNYVIFKPVGAFI